MGAAVDRAHKLTARVAAAAGDPVTLGTCLLAQHHAVPQCARLCKLDVM